MSVSSSHYIVSFFVISLSGICILIQWMKYLAFYHQSSKSVLMDKTFTLMFSLMILSGAIFVGTAVLGVFYLRSSRIFLTVAYFVFLGFSLCITVVASIFQTVSKNKVFLMIFHSIKSQMRTYHIYDESKYSIDFLQRNIHCCGAMNYSDWGMKHLPKSCCISSDECSSSSELMFRKGCFLVIKKYLNDNMKLFIVLNAVLLTLIASLLLKEIIRKRFGRKSGGLI